jgi:hypothetical protein
MVQLGFSGFMAGNASRKNGQKGGRPSGRKNDATLEREAQLARFKQRVFEAFDPLINAQLSLARGLSYLFKEDINDDGSKGKPKRLVFAEKLRDPLHERIRLLLVLGFQGGVVKPQPHRHLLQRVPTFLLVVQFIHAAAHSTI